MNLCRTTAVNGRRLTGSNSHPLMKKKQGKRNRKKMTLKPMVESPKQKWQICEKTTRIIVNPRMASMYSILCLTISTAKVQKKPELFAV